MKPRLRSRLPAPARGFTLVELMVAMTGGLFVAVVVFTLAKDGSRFYLRESRVADATLSAVAGFERLRSDLSRISFLSSPNVRRDPRLCGGDPIGANWPTGLVKLAGLRIDPATPTPNAALAANNRKPDSIVIGGGFASTELFPIIGVTDTGNGFRVELQTNLGPLLRRNYAAIGSVSDQLTYLQDVFLAQGQKGRALRIVDQSGKVQYGTIADVAAAGGPAILLAQRPGLRMRGTSDTTCGLHGLSRGYANVVNFVRYQVRPIDVTQSPGYAPLYNAGATPWDATRTDLVRDELDIDGTIIPGTEEVVSEYAVDLQFGVTVAQNFTNGSVSQLTSFAPGNAGVAQWAGDTVSVGTALPQRVQALRVRLSIRSREPDRDLDIAAGGPVAAGLYRFRLPGNAKSQFARVRTLQADMTLQNQMGIPW